MGRLQLSARECNYKELNRQLKEQFIHGLNNNDMLGEIIKELTKIHKNREITSENVLFWDKRVEAQRAQSAIMDSLTEVKEFDKLKIAKNTYKDSLRTSSSQTKMPAKQSCRYCACSHPLRQCLAYGKKWTECNKISYFRAVCKSRRARAVNEVEQNTAQDSAEENSIDSVNINSIHFNINCSVITVKLKKHQQA